MNKLPEDGINTEDLLLEFFPDERRRSEDGEAPPVVDEFAGSDDGPVAQPLASPPQGQDVAATTASAEFAGAPVAAEFAAAPVAAEATQAAIVPDRPAPDRHEPEASGARSRLLRPLLILLALLAFGGISFLAGRGAFTDDSGQETATEEDQVASEADNAVEAPVVETDADEADAAAPAEPADDTNTTTSADTEADGDSAPAEEETSPPTDSERPFVEVTPNATDWPGYPEDPEDSPATGPYIIIKNGDFFLRGTLSSEELRQEMAWFTLEVVPEENVVVEYQVDPNDPFVLGDVIPVFFADVVLFDVSSEQVNEDDLRDLALLGVQFLMTNPTAVYTLIGHTDSSGSESVNQALSLRRAEAVRDFYISLGAPPDQVIAVGMGESDPVADNDTEAGRAQNRRVEFKFTNSG